MYYTFGCTYCGREFYTYNKDKHHAANTLYHAVKIHLRDYNEDHKEYQLDDGEHADTEQIYHEMKAHAHKPVHAYEANEHSQATANAHSTSPHGTAPAHHSPSYYLLFIIILLIIFASVGIYLFFPNIITDLQEIFALQ